MASFGGVDLGTKGAAVFELTTESDDEEFIYRLTDGAVAVIPPCCGYMVVRDCPGADFADTHANAREAANRAIDVYFGQGGRPLLLAHKDSPYVVGWNSPAGRMLRVVGINHMTSRLRAHAVACDLDGNAIEQPPQPSKMWHESLRYYRVSESSMDLYDSFRNLYLAIEAILSDRVSPELNAKGNLEGDCVWLERALKTVGRAIDLAPYAPVSPKAPSNAIHQELYVNLRTAIFHAKKGRAVWAPQDWSSRSVIVEARVRYARMFRALANHYLNIGYPGGGMFQSFWEEIMEANLSGQLVFVSNDLTAVADEPQGEYQPAPSGGAVLLLPTAAAEDMAGDWCRGVNGVTEASTVKEDIGTVSRFGTLLDGELTIVESLRAPLDVGDVDELQVVILVEGRNYGAPSQDFES